MGTRLVYSFNLIIGGYRIAVITSASQAENGGSIPLIRSQAEIAQLVEQRYRKP